MLQDCQHVQAELSNFLDGEVTPELKLSNNTQRDVISVCSVHAANQIG